MPKEPDYTVTTPEKARRARRWLRRMGIAALVLFLGIPTYFVVQTRWGISLALDSAAEVRLEEHVFDRVLTSRALAPADFAHVTEALPVTAGYGVPGMAAMCFVPHHRIVIVPRDGRASTTLEVCFGCEQFCVSNASILPTPFAWQRSLRQLFIRHDIPIRENYRFSLSQNP